MIVICRGCDVSYEHNPQQDTFNNTLDVSKVLIQKQVTLHLCDKCDSVVGITVNDEYGSTVYMPYYEENDANQIEDDECRSESEDENSIR